MDKYRSCLDKNFYTVLYEGYATYISETTNGKKKNSYLIHFDDYDFQIPMTDKLVRACGELVRRLEHPKLFIIEHDKFQKFSLVYDKKEKTKDFVQYLKRPPSCLLYISPPYSSTAISQSALLSQSAETLISIRTHIKLCCIDL